MSELRLATASIARRQCCYNLCERMLRNELTASDAASVEDTGDVSQPTIFALVSRSASTLDCSDTDFASRQTRTHQEVAKLLYGRGLTQDAVEVMTTTVCQCMSLIDSLTSCHKSAANIRELSARSLLSLSKWLQADSRQASQFASLVQTLEQTDADTFTGRLSMLINMASNSEAGTPGICIELSSVDRREYSIYM